MAYIDWDTAEDRRVEAEVKWRIDRDPKEASRRGTRQLHTVSACKRLGQSENVRPAKTVSRRPGADFILAPGRRSSGSRIILKADSTKAFNFVGMPPGTILLTPLRVRINCQRKRLWQQTDCSRKGLPCTAAFACTDYKVQGRTLERVALELRGTRTTNFNGEAVPLACDPCSLYVQLSRCPTLDGIMLLSKVRKRDFIGNTTPESMTIAKDRLEDLSETTLVEFHTWQLSLDARKIALPTQDSSASKAASEMCG
ncbi:hypothetical protein X797_012120 [Metarhizium robertsii]|uniref:Uncharacterized protein n=1 Tax=Metarhizium robertsii TaxID=568076 RepID=A0A014P0R8_9HYPO|nr:hypothetical protein X797_012120 [Metarhizium robertsii]